MMFIQSSLLRTMPLKVSTNHSLVFRLRTRSVLFCALFWNTYAFEARPFLLFHTLCNREAIHSPFQWLSELLRCCWYRTFRWPTTSPTTSVPWPTCDHTPT